MTVFSVRLVSLGLSNGSEMSEKWSLFLSDPIVNNNTDCSLIGHNHNNYNNKWTVILVSQEKTRSGVV